MKLLPRLTFMRDAWLSDDRGPDAEGPMLSIEWGRFIFEVAMYRRGSAK